MATGEGRGPKRLHVEVAGERRLVTVEPVGPIGDAGSRFLVSWDDTKYEVDASRLRSGALSLIVPAVGHASHEVTCHETAPGDLLLGIDGRRVRALVTDGRSRGTGTAGPANIGEHRVASPMPGRVVRVPVEPGDVVDV
ncbi:MAG: hypothetical protein QGG89_13100, partial [Vicinamibacterales bacterium]|nr:hypothetical protein [Vicinamibacterales bacterium]